MAEEISIEQLIGNILGVMHNVKSSLMAVNGYVDILASEKSGEIYENAKQATVVVETLIDNLVFAIRALRDAEPKELSMNQCVRSAVEFIRSNRTFRSKAKFDFEFTEDDAIYAEPAQVMKRLDVFLSGTAERSLAEGEYKLTVATVRESKSVCARIGDAEVAFPSVKA